MFEKFFQRSVDVWKMAIRRFPITLLLATITTILCVVFLEVDPNYDLQTKILRWLLPLSIGIPTSLALHIRLENVPVKPLYSAILFGSLLVLLAGYAYWLPDDDLHYSTSIYLQWFLLFVAAHLLISVSIQFKGVADRRLWAFNMHVLMRFITGVLFTAALNLGIILAIAASDFLFNISIESIRYVQVTAISHVFLMTAFVIAGIPDQATRFEWEDKNPSALRLFNLYVLLPLAFLYLAILLAYSAKVAISMTLPDGIVASMILYYALVGIVAHLLTLPLQDENDSKIPTLFGRFFRYTLPFVLILFWLAIGLRVDSYGLTMPRSLVIYMGIWLTGIAIWGLVKNGRPIRYYPLTLAIIVLVAAIGPFSISKLSRESQIHQLSLLLTDAEGTVLNEKIRNAGPLDSETISRINSGIYYLSDSHGVRSLQPLSSEPIDSVVSEFAKADSTFFRYSFEVTNRLLIRWNVPQEAGYLATTYISFSHTGSIDADITGFDKYESIDYQSQNDTLTQAATLFSSGDVNITLDSQNGTINYQLGDSITHQIDLRSYIMSQNMTTRREWLSLIDNQAIVRSGEPGSDAMMLIIASGNLTSVEGTESWKIQSLQGRLFIRMNP